jgi:hypothetical protein
VGGSALPFLRRDDADGLLAWLDSGGALETQGYDSPLTGTPAEFAAFHGRLGCLRLLAERGAKLERALALAIQNRQHEATEFLRARGVQPAPLEPAAATEPYVHPAPAAAPQQQSAVPSSAEPDPRSRPIADLDFSVRTEHCMESEGIKTIGELCLRTPEELLEIRNFGEVCLREIVGKLAEIGLRLSK